MAEYKSTFKLRSTDDIFAALEENTVMLSTMKASKFFIVFEKDIMHWERTLSHISETIEIILQVGRGRAGRGRGDQSRARRGGR